MSNNDQAASKSTVESVVRLVDRMNPFLLRGLIEADELSRSRGQERIRITDVIDAFHGHKPNAGLHRTSESQHNEKG